MTKLERLNWEKSRKFDAICASVARELGYGGLSELSCVDRAQVEREVKQYLKECEEAVQLRARRTSRPMPLRRLLSEYRDVCERILDEHEIEVGLWAYKRAARHRLGRRAH